MMYLLWMLIGIGTQATIAAVLGHYKIIEISPKQQMAAGAVFFIVAMLLDIGRRLGHEH